MFKTLLALTACAAADNAIAQQVGVIKNYEMQATKTWVTRFVKEIKISYLHGKYRDSRFIQTWAGILNKEIGARGIPNTCDHTKFNSAAECFARETADVWPDQPDHKQRMMMAWMSCAKVQGCAPQTMAEPGSLDWERSGMKKLEEIAQGSMREQERQWEAFGKWSDQQQRQWEQTQGGNVKKLGELVGQKLGCSMQCVQSEMGRMDPKQVFQACGCKMPAEMQFSGDDMLDMVDSIKFDPLAAADDVELAAEPTADSGSSWGWMAFGALATANAAYYAVNKKEN